MTTASLATTHAHTIILNFSFIDLHLTSSSTPLPRLFIADVLVHQVIQQALTDMEPDKGAENMPGEHVEHKPGTWTSPPRPPPTSPPSNLLWNAPVQYAEERMKIDNRHYADAVDRRVFRKDAIYQPKGPRAMPPSPPPRSSWPGFTSRTNNTATATATATYPAAAIAAATAAATTSGRPPIPLAEPSPRRRYHRTELTSPLSDDDKKREAPKRKAPAVPAPGGLEIPPGLFDSLTHPSLEHSKLYQGMTLKYGPTC